MPSRVFVVTVFLVSLTWPMSVARLALRYVFVRPYVADDAAMLAIPASALIAGVAVVVSIRWPSTDPMAWVVRCSIAGALSGDVWLAIGAFVQSQRTTEVLLSTLVGGLLYGAPVGLVVGMVLGAEVLALQRWRRQLTSPRSTWPFVVTTVIINAVVAVALWHWTDLVVAGGDRAGVPAATWRTT